MANSPRHCFYKTLPSDPLVGRSTLFVPVASVLFPSESDLLEDREELVEEREKGASSALPRLPAIFPFVLVQVNRIFSFVIMCLKRERLD